MSYREGRFWQPDVTVATVVVGDGRLLCVEERSNGQLVINQPAGHLEPDESLVDATVRETRASRSPPKRSTRSPATRWTRASCARCG